MKQCHQMEVVWPKNQSKECDILFKWLQGRKSEKVRRGASQGAGLWNKIIKCMCMWPKNQSKECDILFEWIQGRTMLKRERLVQVGPWGQGYGTISSNGCRAVSY